MNVYTFSLPEGCDLKLQTYWTSASVHVVFKDRTLCVIDTFILGEGVSVRRGILGTSIVSKTPDPVSHYDFSRHIRNALKNHQDNCEAQEMLEANLKHFEGMSVDSQTLSMLRSTAQASFDQTRERIRRTAEASLLNERQWVSQALSFPTDMVATEASLQNERQWGFQAIDPPVATTAPQVFEAEVLVNGVRHVLVDNGTYRAATGQQIQITASGRFVNVHDIS